jgi:ABC-2 type transport system ATP-binding protein
MVQRIGLAQAIQHDPELIILDEPMSGLDPVGRREVRDLILSLKDKGKTIFFSSHILQDAEMLCDRVAILDRGSLRSIGHLREMVADGARWFEVAIRGQLPDQMGWEPISESADGSLVRVTDVESLGELLGLVRQSGGEVLSVWPRRETLEDLFLREIGRMPGGEGKQ